MSTGALVQVECSYVRTVDTGRVSSTLSEVRSTDPIGQLERKRRKDLGVIYLFISSLLTGSEMAYRLHHRCASAKCPNLGPDSSSLQ
jgi:hypothetical protein